MIIQQEFEEKISKFKELEDIRGHIEEGFLKLIKDRLDFEAYIFILSTWNYANFRFILKKLKYEDFKRAISETNPLFEKLKNERFETADFDKLKEDISFIYNGLKEIVGPTGATKIMYFKNQNLFVMWDTQIRKLYKFSNYFAEDYIKFLELMRKTFSHINWGEDKKTSFARAIDKYNFVITQEKIRVNNNEKK